MSIGVRNENVARPSTRGQVLARSVGFAHFVVCDTRSDTRQRHPSTVADRRRDGTTPRSQACARVCTGGGAWKWALCGAEPAPCQVVVRLAVQRRREGRDRFRRGAPAARCRRHSVHHHHAGDAESGFAPDGRGRASSATRSCPGPQIRREPRAACACISARRAHSSWVGHPRVARRGRSRRRCPSREASRARAREVPSPWRKVRNLRKSVGQSYPLTPALRAPARGDRRLEEACRAPRDAWSAAVHPAIGGWLAKLASALRRDLPTRPPTWTGAVNADAALGRRLPGGRSRHRPSRSRAVI